MHLKADIYLFNGIMKGEMIYDINNKIILDKVVLFYILLVYLKNCFPLFFFSRLTWLYYFQEAYTRVLLGHIDLALGTFRTGVYGTFLTF